METPTRSRLGAIATAIWVVAVVAGLAILAHYSSTPGSRSVAAASWPAGTDLSLDADLPTLVICLHATCPCSRASVEELARIHARVGGAVAMRALLRTPVSERTRPPSAVARRVGEIPGLLVVDDPGGVRSARLGARTSGEVFLYDPSGALRFHGGITAGRGHEGMSAGRREVESILRGERRDRTPIEVPTFGCPLGDARDEEAS